MDQVTDTIDWDALSDDELDAMERKIAAKYMQKLPIGIIAWGFTNTLVWLALWPLVLMDILAVMVCISYRSAERHARLPTLT